MFTGKTIGFIGAGNMAEALINGLIASGKVSAARIVVSDSSRERLVHIAGKYGVTVHNRNYEAAAASDIIVLAVKPRDMEAVVNDMAMEVTPEKLVITVAAGVTIDSIKRWLASGGMTGKAVVVRAMPNTPSLIGEGAIGIAPSEEAGRWELDLAESLLGATGKVVVMADESLMDAVTGLSGSGPAYVFIFIKALVDAGVSLGMDPKDAKTLAIQTTLGAARLAEKSEKDLQALIDMVTSPGGTTIEGLKKLKEGRFCDIVFDAVRAATERSKELSKGK
jgi:pyrroline-5-carboxylate reductase